MKVTGVEIFDIHIDEVPIWHPLLIRVNTDEGISVPVKAVVWYLNHLDGKQWEIQK
jgi:hypothetical protein